MDFKQVFHLLQGVINSILWGTLLLILSIIILPEYVFLGILKKLKPNLVSKSSFMSRLRLVFDFIFNNKEIIFEDQAVGATKTLQNEVVDLMHEKRLLEGNLFFLDLLQNLSQMLMFSVTQIGYELPMVCNILEQSMEYLIYYAKKLRASKTSQNIEERVYLAASQLQAQVNDTASFLQKDQGEEFVKKVTRMTMQQNTSVFDSFMKAEYQSTKENLIRTNQLLAEKFLIYVGDAQ